MKVGWIGTGVMGLSMCRHLLRHKVDLSVYSRTASKAQPLLEQGARWVLPSDMAAQVDILFLMLGYPREVQEMCLGEKGVLRFLRKGAVVVDHTTSTPHLAQRLHAQAEKVGVGSVDAPVSGGDVGAKEGRLVVMCGGQTHHLQLVRPFIDCYSRAVHLHGAAGCGQHAKMTNQIVLAGNMAGTVEGLLYASKMGLDLNRAIETISLGAASSVAFTVLGKRMVDGNFAPGFYVDHYIKDMEIALEEAERAQLNLSCLRMVREFYLELKAMGGGLMGTQALIKVLEKRNNHTIHKQ